MSSLCCAKSYFCPEVGQFECAEHGGFDTCCDRPDLHITDFITLIENLVREYRTVKASRLALLKAAVMNNGERVLKLQDSHAHAWERIKEILDALAPDCVV